MTNPKAPRSHDRDLVTGLRAYLAAVDADELSVRDARDGRIVARIEGMLFALTGRWR